MQPQYMPFEISLESESFIERPFDSVQIRAEFVSPTGSITSIDGFWDGGNRWKVRHMPRELGEWSYQIHSNLQSLNQSGRFTVIKNDRDDRFSSHGPVRLSTNHRYMVHHDGTPFFWMADTCWNGPMKSNDVDWALYLRHRKRQAFTAVQWVTTQFVGWTKGDEFGNQAFSLEHGELKINPVYFQRLDRKVEQINAAGLLSVPVMIWASEWSPDPAINLLNPASLLSDEQLVQLGKYMLARWGAYHTFWILNGDGFYTGEKAARWLKLGEVIFGDRSDQLVSLHPSGCSWPQDEYREADWLSIIGYQSSHGVDERLWRWMFEGPPATKWKEEPVRPVINLEPSYEYHINGYSADQSRFTPHNVRQALYSSLLVSPTAGVTYGGHGVWGWSNGNELPENHPHTGIPLPFREAIQMPGAEQVLHLREVFDSVHWWELKPDQELLREQPGRLDAWLVIPVSSTENREEIVTYLPKGGKIAFNDEVDLTSYQGKWIDPKTGDTEEALPEGADYLAPDQTDWVLILRCA